MRTQVRRSGLHCFDSRQVLCNVFSSVDAPWGMSKMDSAITSLTIPGGVLSDEVIL
jgi:hypothetical protein